MARRGFFMILVACCIDVNRATPVRGQVAAPENQNQLRRCASSALPEAPLSVKVSKRRAALPTPLLLRVSDGGAARVSNGVVLARRFAGASVQTGILFTFVRVVNELPLSASALLSKIGILPEPEIMGVPSMQWLAFCLVIMPPNLVKRLLSRKSDVDKRPPGWYTEMRPGWSPPVWSFPLLKFGVAKPTMLLALAALWQQASKRSFSVLGAGKPWMAAALTIAHSSFADAWREVFFEDRRLGLAALFAFLSLGALLAAVSAFVGVDVRITAYLVPSVVIALWSTAMNLAVCMPRRPPPRPAPSPTPPVPEASPSMATGTLDETSISGSSLSPPKGLEETGSSPEPGADADTGAGAGADAESQADGATDTEAEAADTMET